MMCKTKKLFLVLLGAFLLCLSCARNNQQENDNGSFFWHHNDSYGREVILKTEPQRIISLSPCLTEIIFLLGGENKLIGISDFCHYPPATDSIPRIGGLTNCNVEAIFALRPDVVLIGSIVAQETVNRIEKAGIPVIAIRAESSLDDLAPTIMTIGEILNETARATDTMKAMRKRLEDLRQRCSTDAGTGKTVYYVVGFGPGGDFTAPAHTHIDEMITLAGKRNVGKDLQAWNISREYLFQQNPDIIIIRSEDYDTFIHTPPYHSLKAVKQGHVYPIESGTIDVISPRNLDAIEKIRNME